MMGTKYSANGKVKVVLVAGISREKHNGMSLGEWSCGLCFLQDRNDQR